MEDSIKFGYPHTWQVIEFIEHPTIRLSKKDIIEVSEEEFEKIEISYPSKQRWQWTSYGYHFIERNGEIIEGIYKKDTKKFYYVKRE